MSNTHSFAEVSIIVGGMKVAARWSTSYDTLHVTLRYLGSCPLKCQFHETFLCCISSIRTGGCWHISNCCLIYHLGSLQRLIICPSSCSVAISSAVVIWLPLTWLPSPQFPPMYVLPSYPWHLLPLVTPLTTMWQKMEASRALTVCLLGNGQLWLSN